jgi:hypothetical protein
MLPRPGDTEGVQRTADWEWQGRLIVEHDSTLTLTRIRIDTAGVVQRHDVMLTRFDFDPAAGLGDEYVLTLGLDLGVARDLPIREVIPIGPAPGSIQAFGTVTRLGTPLRPDSVRGAFMLEQRGLRTLTGRIQATLFFTPWDETTGQVTYQLQQKIYGVK